MFSVIWKDVEFIGIRILVESKQRLINYVVNQFCVY